LESGEAQRGGIGPEKEKKKEIPGGGGKKSK